MSEDSKKIVINLDKLESTDVLDRKNLIFRDQLDLLVEKISRKVEENRDLMEKKECNKKKEQNDDVRGVPSCFFIDGSRGSGKSTLMRAVRDALVNPESRLRQRGPALLYPLADIDPTELGKGENFFLYLLARIYKVLDDCYKKRVNRDESVDEIRTAMEDLRKLSGGLQVLMDADGALKKSGNPEFFLEECIDKCADSMSLRKKLCELLGKLSEIVKEDVFLVTIDDADLNFSKCKDMLEYIRKYMQTPRLIFLFAGDMKLYFHVVRGMHIDNFCANQLQYDISRADSRQELLENMEDQYIKKFFPVENCVKTEDLQEVLKERSLLIQRYEGDEQGGSFYWYIRNYLTSKINLKVEGIIINTITQLPSRSVFFLLRYLVEKNCSEDSTDSMKHIQKGLHDMFQSSLMNYNIDSKQFGMFGIGALQKTIFQYYIKGERWNDDLSLLASAGNYEAQKISLYLETFVVQRTQSLSEKLSYWCACYPAWHTIREFYSRKHDAAATRDLAKNCLKQGNDGAKNNFANLACAAIAPNTSSPVLFGRGTICLLNEDRLEDKESGKLYRRGMNSLVRDLLHSKENFDLPEKRYILALNLSLCRLDDEKNSYYYLSVYHLLMEIAEWLDWAANKMKRINENVTAAKMEEMRYDMKKAIRNRLQSLRIAPNTVRFKHGMSGDVEPTVYSSLSHIYDFGGDSALVEEIYSWLQENVNIKYITSAVEFSRSWDVFLARCRELTVSYQSQYEKEEFCPQAAPVFRQYMRAAQNALLCLSGDKGGKLAQCISSFPLWNILIEPPHDCSKVEELLNSAYIGDFVNLSVKNEVEQLRNEYENSKRLVSTIESKKQRAKQRYEADAALLQELLREKENKEAEQQLRNSQVEKIDKDISELQQEINKCLEEENDAAQEADMVNLSEAERTIEKRRVLLKWDLLNKILKGEDKNIISYDILHDEMKKIQRLLRRAVTNETKKKHESTLELIHDLRNELQRAEIEKKLGDVWKKACEEKESVESWKFPVIYMKLDSKNKERKAKFRRQQAEKKLSRIMDDSKSFREQAFETEVDCKLAALKYERMQKEVNELQRQCDELNQSLRLEQMLCAAAKRVYDAAK